MTKPISKLTPRQLRFVDAYLAVPNAAAAAARAGYSRDTAPQQGSRLLSNVNIQNAIAKRHAALAAKQSIRIEDTLRENARIAFRDLRRLFQEDGTMLPVPAWPDDIAAAVASIETRELYEGEGENRKLVGFTHKVKFEDKGAALERFFRYQRLYVDAPPADGDTTHIVQNNFRVDLLDADERQQLRDLLRRALPKPQDSDS